MDQDQAPSVGFNAVARQLSGSEEGEALLARYADLFERQAEVRYELAKLRKDMIAAGLATSLPMDW